MIDNYEKTMLLVEKMKQHLPIPMQATPELLKTINEQQENKYSRNHLFAIDGIFYAGDHGGITCNIHSDSEAKTAFVVSLTHLRIANGKPGQAKRIAKKSRAKKGFN